jgi:hypothetical protein
MSHTIDRPPLPTRLAISALAYLGSLCLALVVTTPSASGQLRPAGYFPR